MSRLWDSVLEGTFDNDSGNNNDHSDYEAEIESMVTDAPESMVAYVGMCTEGMLAVDAAMATIEGQCAVQYLSGKREEAQATMEGVLRNAWETIKDWIERAYHAIKKFIKKAWNKMKGYVNVFKGMVTKYAYVLKSTPTNIKVDWVYVDMARGAHYYEVASNQIDNEYIKNGKNQHRNASNYGSNKNFHRDLENAFFGGNTTSKTINANKQGVASKTVTTALGRFVQPVDWKDVARDAIRIADDGFDKAYSEAFKLGELTERDLIKEINRLKSDAHDKNDDSDDSDTTKETNERLINAWARRRTNLCRAYTAMVNTAASIQVRVAVKACRKVIKAQAKKSTSDNSSATFGVESDFSAVMAEIL